MICPKCWLVKEVAKRGAQAFPILNNVFEFLEFLWTRIFVLTTRNITSAFRKHIVSISSPEICECGSKCREALLHPWWASSMQYAGLAGSKYLISGVECLGLNRFYQERRTPLKRPPLFAYFVSCAVAAIVSFASWGVLDCLIQEREIYVCHCSSIRFKTSAATGTLHWYLPQK